MQQKESLDGLGSTNLVLFEAFQLDLTGGGLFRLDQAGIATPVSISSRALDLLGLLVERQGQLVSKESIMGAVWPGTVVEEGNLTVHVSALRRILDENREEGSCIQTVPGRGYRFTAPVTRVQRAARPDSSPSSGNGIGGTIVEKAKLQGPVPLGEISSTPGPIGKPGIRIGSASRLPSSALYVLSSSRLRLRVGIRLGSEKHARSPAYRSSCCRSPILATIGSSNILLTASQRI